MNIYIHWNGYDFEAPEPQKDVWCNYQNPDSAKMLLVCAASWRFKGWNPVRLDSSNVKDGFKFTGMLHHGPNTPMLATGQLHYPVELWNVWFMLRDLAPCWVITTDMLNRNFQPEQAKQLELDHHGLAISLQKPWTNAAMFVTRWFCMHVIKTIMDVDEGILPMPAGQIITDEMIIRERNMMQYVCHPIGRFAWVDDKWDEAQLLHFSRSSILRGLERLKL